MASRVDTGIQGFSSPQASPFTADTPIRSPVKDPGPAATAKASISAAARPQFRSMSSTMGSRVRLWVSPAACQAEARSSPPAKTAQEAAFAELSSARSFIGFPPPRS